MAMREMRKVKVDKNHLIRLFEEYELSYREIGKLCNRSQGSISRYLIHGEMPMNVAIDIAKGLHLELHDIAQKGFSKRDLREFISVLSDDERRYISERL